MLPWLVGPLVDGWYGHAALALVLIAAGALAGRAVAQKMGRPAWQLLAMGFGIVELSWVYIALCAMARHRAWDRVLEGLGSSWGEGLSSDGVVEAFGVGLQDMKTVSLFGAISLGVLLLAGCVVGAAGARTGPKHGSMILATLTAVSLFAGLLALRGVRPAPSASDAALSWWEAEAERLATATACDPCRRIEGLMSHRPIASHAGVIARAKGCMESWVQHTPSGLQSCSMIGWEPSASLRAVDRSEGRTPYPIACRRPATPGVPWPTDVRPPRDELLLEATGAEAAHWLASPLMLDTEMREQARKQLEQAESTLALRRGNPELVYVRSCGPLSQAWIQNALQAELGRLRVCMRQGTRTDPCAAGEVALKVTVGRDFGVVGVQELSALPDRALMDCFAKTIRSMRFPRSAEDVQVDFALRVKSES
jgi:hypothetical protein